MALINCKECNHSVSSTAATCPNCGAPVATANETRAAGQQITTMQETSKKFKLHYLACMAVIVIGIVWGIGSAQNPDSEPSGIPVLMVTVGFIWYLVTRFRVWWHHK